MPAFEQSSSHRRNISSQGSYSYDRILAIYNEQGDKNDPKAGVAARQNRVHISIKDNITYDQNIKDADTKSYQRMAGADLSNIFMPFQTKINVSGSLPGFHKTVPSGNVNQLPSGNNITTHDMMPFRWEPAETDDVYDYYSAPSGDSLKGIISAETQYGNVDQIRDIGNQRTIGLRLPLMGVGWGYTLEEKHPWPSGSVSNPAAFPSGARFFKGGLTKGYQLDPSDYVAAPIDFRYDIRRNVWTCGGESVPRGQGIYKVLVDDQDPGTTSFQYPRFHG